MKKQNAIAVCKGIIFILIGILLFQVINHIFMGKSTYAKYRNYQVQDEIDVMIMGSSHADAAFAPQEMEKVFEETYGQEVSVFNYSISGMRIEHLSYFMEEALKKNKPKLIVLETFTFVPIAEEHREVLSRWAFDMLPLNSTKIEAIQYCAPEDKWSYYLPFIAYHSRWKELSAEDFKLVFSEKSWDDIGETLPDVNEQMENVDDYFEQNVKEIDELQPINATEKESLEKVIQLAEENDIKILFVSVPFKEQLDMDSMEMIKINNFLQENYVNGDTIQILDMNRQWEELDFGYGDLYDEGHCNKFGAAKVTGCLMDYITRNYQSDDILE